MSSWKTLILRIGEKCPEYGGTLDFKEHIDTCYSLLWRELDQQEDHEILYYVLQCAQQLPHKSPFYGTLIGLLNLEKEDLGQLVVDTTHSNLQHALRSENCDSIRVLLRFLTVLMCSKVLQPASLVVVFETLLSSAATIVDEEKGNPAWQARADFYISCVLSCLPWGGAELMEQVPEEIDRVLVGIQAYLSIRRHVLDSGFSIFVDVAKDQKSNDKNMLFFWCLERCIGLASAACLNEEMWIRGEEEKGTMEIESSCGLNCRSNQTVLRLCSFDFIINLVYSISSSVQLWLVQF